MISKKQIGKNIGYSLLSQIMSLLISSLIYLVLPKLIPNLEYANWQVYSLYISYVGICHLGLLDGIVLRYSEYDYDEIDEKRIRSQFLFLLCVLLFFSLLLLVIGGLFLKEVTSITLILIAIGLITKNVVTYSSYTFQITNRIKHYALFSIGRSVIFGVATIALFVAKVDAFYWYCLVDIVADIVIVTATYNWNSRLYFGIGLPIREMLLEAKENIKAGIQLMISNWASMFLVGSAKMFVQWRWSLLLFGKVSFAFTLANLFLVFVGAISVVLFPSLKRMDQDKLPDLYRSIRTIMTPCLFCILVFYFPGCLILDLWLPNYHESLYYLGVLFPMIVYTSQTSLIINNYLKAFRCERKMFIINVTTMIIGIIVFYVTAYVFNDLNLVLYSTVALIIGRTIVSEMVISNIIGISFKLNNIIEVLWTVAFIICARIEMSVLGLVTYLCISVIATLFYVNNWKKITK